MDRPRPQELYRHFKGNLYQIVTIAIHSETREEMVVYQALYDDYKVYVRPLDMFMSKVDRDKYPTVRQEYRFEKVDPSGLKNVARKTPEPEKSYKTSLFDEEPAARVFRPEKTEETRMVFEEKKPSEKVSIFGETPVQRVSGTLEERREKFRDDPYKHSEVMDKSVDQEAEELNLNPLVIEFMDADLAVDKNEILSKLRPIITNDMIDIMAMSLGVVVNEGDVYDRYNDLRTCLTTMEKFESTRLR